VTIVDRMDIGEAEILLIDLVQINSINPGLVSTGVGEAAVGAHVSAWAKAAGLEVSIESVAEEMLLVTEDRHEFLTESNG
jgi:acetylornithine deacetylase/succinyl-diaminopimelate desuccinylase-like protein